MRNYAVIGDPVGHSRSPGMQNAAFEHYRLGSPYVKRHVRPGELGAFVEEARRTLAGFNCTVPHKSAIIPYLDEVDPKALAASSVNTVTVREDGTLAGTSTDGYGLEMALETNFGRPLAGAEVCFIGCGG
ncbi:MAG TPA: shikimate dehydrogenase, partial [Lentisphaeria bacterium]|nr:shikimate dehydrogenase [Lentisphaeria bacterium]